MRIVTVKLFVSVSELLTQKQTKKHCTDDLNKTLLDTSYR